MSGAGNLYRAAVIGGGHNPAYPGDVRRLREITDEPSTTIAAQVGGGAGNAGPFVVGHLDRPSPTVTAQEVKGTRASRASGWTMSGGPDRASDALWLATGRRRLTIEECAALFDMPADYPWTGTKTSRYRQIGNMVAWRIAEMVTRAVISAN